MKPRRQSAVGIANEKVPIAFACRLIGLDVDTDAAYGRSVKVHCPFGEIHHSDGGADKAMRVYVDTNSAYCFAGCGHFTPVRLVAHAWGRPAGDVAGDLLARIGYRPPATAEVFASLVDYQPVPDRAHLAEALKAYCRRTVPDWAAVQFDPVVAGRLSRCLTVLDRVVDEASAAVWLEGSKRIMSTERPT